MSRTDSPPPSSRSRALTVACWLVILGVVAAIMLGHALGERATAAAADTSASTADSFDMQLLGRMVVSQARALSKATDPVAADKVRAQLQSAIDRLATTPHMKLQAAVLVREVSGPTSAVKYLAQHAPDFTASRAFTADAAALTALYGHAGSLAVDAAQRDSLRRDLGWFADLALSQGRPDADPARAAVLAAASRTTIVSVVAIALIVLGFASGLALLILFIVRFATGKMRFTGVPRATVDHPVYLETFAIWLAMFVVVSKAMAYLPRHPSLVVSEAIVLVASFAVALWPLARGASWAQLRATLGWHAGRGVLREIGLGLVGYLAGLPIVGVGVVLTLVLSRLGHVSPSHPITQELGPGMSVAQIAGLMFAAAVAAPLLEETMFRGAFYGHLRRRWGVPLSIAVVAFIFAAIHPQGWAAIPVLGSIAVVLALLREWRGSLLAPIAAHALNNGFVLLFATMALR